MADPNKYTPGYSFSGWQATNPDQPLPAPQLDNELQNISEAVGEAIDGVKNIRRSDGALQNEIVTFDSLSREVRSQIGPGALAAAEAAAASAVEASGYASAADAARIGAETARTGAQTAQSAAEAARDTALNAPNTFIGTSTSSVAIGVGAKTFTTQAGLFFAPGNWVLIVDNAQPLTNYMQGQVLSYSGTTLIVSVVATGGTGTLANWTITVSGTQGVPGPQGPAGAGTGDMLAANNLSELTNKPVARTNLGVGIGTNVQAYSLLLDGFAAATAASGGLKKTGANTVGTFTLTAAAESVLDDTTTDAMLTTLGGSAAGVTLFKAADAAAQRTALSVYSTAQVDAAIAGKITQVKRVVITATGTYTPSTGLVYADVEVVGGGGSGARSTNAGNGGGGAGGYAKKRFTAAEIGASQSVTIGNGGGARTSNGNGNTGGTTSFGALMSASGGGGGQQGSGTSGYAEGGKGGGGSGGDINMRGGAAVSSWYTTGTESIGTQGGNSVFGGGASAASGEAGIAGQANSGGGGSGGGGVNQNSGAGGSGICIITEYLNV